MNFISLKTDNMKTTSSIPTRRLALVALALLGLTARHLAAAAFSSGSDGSYGPMNITQNTTLSVPSNGVFNCTTITIGCAVNLSFAPNALNTPVYLLATGDVYIYGYIYLDAGGGNVAQGGGGGPGGFPGGMGGIAGGHTTAGDGAGPGGGKDASGWFGGVFAYPQNANTNVYGNALLYPLVGGSGGSGKDAAAGGNGGGGGGGAILIASSTRIMFSTQCYPGTEGVYARGGAGTGNLGGGGSGGAIRLVAPTVGTINGTGYLDTSGGLGGQVCCYTYPDTGSQGRIRIDCTDDYSYRALIYRGSFTRGSQMWVFQPNTPELDIISAAGQSIPVGATNSVYVSLPAGSPTNQLVTLSAANFTNSIPIRISVTPDTGPSVAFDGVIPNTGNPSTNSFNVNIPAGAVSRIDAWTR